MDKNQIKTALEYIESSKKVTTTGKIDDVLYKMEKESNIKIDYMG